ncbi:hypothetical protein GGX14DRAFT_395669 [Mycena pura]|uniref:Uncharacterized protein n=1 Tax=Mycena pura TaxID=153505 RepID=A0AAD6VCV5_9AGAR|nr:hypothetical protein GGX14DRAFT_395669 [Mycena pura]
MSILENVLPALEFTRAAVTGVGIPGVEGAINGVVQLATMVSTMKANMEDLPDLEKGLNKLIALDGSYCAGELKQRLSALQGNLKPIADRCKSLIHKSGIKQFLKSNVYEKEIQGMKASLASHIRDFTFQGGISIEKLASDMAPKGM